MRIWLFIVTAVFCFIFCSPAIWSQENFAIRNPIGPSTVPPSSISSGVVSNPDPIDTTGNLLITGNVRRGRHFRGSVPYQSTSNFNANLGSASLSSFLRDSAGSEDYGRYSYEYPTQPYYSPSTTVTTMMPGRSGVFMPTIPGIKTTGQQDSRFGGTDVFGFESLPTEQALSSRGLATTDIGLKESQTQYSSLAEPGFRGLGSRATKSTLTRDMSLSLKGAERLVPGEIGISRQGDGLAFEQSQNQIKDIRGSMQDPTTALSLESGFLDKGPKQGPLVKDDSFRYPNSKTSIENLKSKFEMQTPAESTVSGKQTIATRRLPALDELPGVESTSQGDLVSQKGANWPAISGESRLYQDKPSLGEQDNYIKRQVGVVKEDTPDQGQNDVLGRIRQQLDDLTKSIETSLQARPDDASKAGKINSISQSQNKLLGPQRYTLNSRDATQQERIDYGNQLSLYQRGDFRLSGEELAPATTADELGPANNGKPTSFEFPGAPSWESSQKQSSPLDELGKLSQADISAEAKHIMGSYKSLISFSSAKFNQHMRAADDYLKTGRYYQAANTFSLASMYEPDNPLAFAGRGHALLAAGEYISSALFISRALTIDPEYAQTQIDLAAMLGGENELAGRIAEAEQWLARSGSSELQFILSYVYYRTAKLKQAKQTIDAVYEKMPQSKAVQAIRMAIDNAMTKP